MSLVDSVPNEPYTLNDVPAISVASGFFGDQGTWHSVQVPNANSSVHINHNVVNSVSSLQLGNIIVHSQGAFDSQPIGLTEKMIKSPSFAAFRVSSIDSLGLTILNNSFVEFSTLLVKKNVNIFNNVTAQINNTLVIQQNGFIALASPKYLPGAILKYLPGGSYQRSFEWVSG